MKDSELEVREKEREGIFLSHCLGWGVRAEGSVGGWVVVP